MTHGAVGAIGAAGAVEVGATLTEAFGAEETLAVMPAVTSTPALFWLLTGSFFICGVTTNGLIGTHLIPAAMSHGMTQIGAAGLLATIGIFDLIGTLASGWLTDRYDPRKLLFWYYGLRGLSLLALPVVIESQGAGLIAFVVFYGLDWVATVPPTVALTADAFGRDPGFYSFYRSMQAYERSLRSADTLVLAPDSDFFRYFGDPSGKTTADGAAVLSAPPRSSSTTNATK